MSFIVLGVVWLWEIHRGTQNGTLGGMRVGLYYVGAVVLLALGAMGIRERHRRS
jgi:hypothetical protein